MSPAVRRSLGYGAPASTEPRQPARSGAAARLHFVSTIVLSACSARMRPSVRGTYGHGREASAGMNRDAADAAHPAARRVPERRPEVQASRSHDWRHLQRADRLGLRYAGHVFAVKSVSGSRFSHAADMQLRVG